ncbi:hypothetical protein J27TS7_15690 [Paenibacillus dendritiformis]|nr:hypothetical protein J27TS7_15690 [Paenibacillus dendritiformis]
MIRASGGVGSISVFSRRCVSVPFDAAHPRRAGEMSIHCLRFTAAPFAAMLSHGLAEGGIPANLACDMPFFIFIDREGSKAL